MSLRRLMPALRVDDIRVPGNKWVESSDKRFIRYSNRLEISNPGFPLKSPEHLGEPGSELRNPYGLIVELTTKCVELICHQLYRKESKNLEKERLLPSDTIT